MSEPSNRARALRVAFLIDRWDPRRGGAESAMAQLAEHLLARGHRVLAVAEEHAPDAPGEHVRVSVRGLGRSSRERRLARTLVAAAREHGADVTVGCRHLYMCDLYWPHGGAHRPAMEAARAARTPRPPRWWPVHSRHRTFIELERELLERGGARLIACVSQLVMDELAREWPACRERLVLAENGVDFARFHPGARAMLGERTREELGIRPGAVLLVFVARNPHLKGFVALMTAASSLIAFGETDWQLLIAGSRPQLTRGRTSRFLPEHWRELHAPGRIVWREHVDAKGLFAAADLCVLPTWRDPSPLVLLEALASGVPVITTRLAGGCELIDERSGAVLADPSNHQALRGELRNWIERVRAGDVDREHIRSRVVHRDVATWLAGLERIVVDLANGAR